VNFVEHLYDATLRPRLRRRRLEVIRPQFYYKVDDPFSHRASDGKPYYTYIRVFVPLPKTPQDEVCIIVAIRNPRGEVFMRFRDTEDLTRIFNIPENHLEILKKNLEFAYKAKALIILTEKEKEEKLELLKRYDIDLETGEISPKESQPLLPLRGDPVDYSIKALPSPK